MLRLRVALLCSVVAILALPLPSLADGAGKSCHADPNNSQALICVAAGGGSGGGSGSGSGGGSGGGDGGAENVDTPIDPSLTECYGRPANPQPPVGDDAWAGHSPADGIVLVNYCNAAGEARYAFSATAAAAGPPPPTPQELATQAIGQIEIPTPAMNFGPDPNKLAVNFPVWLWTTNPGPISVTVPAPDGSISVQATATLTSTTWEMGEPENPSYPLTLKPAVQCSGAAQGPGRDSDTRNPDCGYTYEWRSLRERTNGVGRWPVRATTTWSVTWQTIPAGPTGTARLTAANNTTVDVGEYSSVIVYGG